MLFDQRFDLAIVATRSATVRILCDGISMIMTIVIGVCIGFVKKPTVAGLKLEVVAVQEEAHDFDSCAAVGELTGELALILGARSSQVQARPM